MKLLTEFLQGDPKQQTQEEVKFSAAAMKEEDGPDSPVLWKEANANPDSHTSPEKAASEKQTNPPPPPRTKEDLYQFYEQVTGPFQELTFKDLVSQVASSKMSLASPISEKQSLSQTTPSSPAFNMGFPSPMVSRSTRHPRSPQIRGNGSRSNPTRTSYDACASPRSRLSPRHTEIPVVEHGSSCHSCQSTRMLLKFRCLVCGKLYCRNCVKEAMGSMLEGRKCKSCLGQRFSQRYIARAGKGWWLSSKIRQAEIRWARKKPKYPVSSQYQMSSASLQLSIDTSSFSNVK